MSVQTEPTTHEPYRWVFAGVEAFVLIGAVSGVVQLWTGTSRRR